ncbi:short-chain fatty acid transporter, partial [Burkholderia multivorans]
TLAERLEESRALSVFVAALCAAFLVLRFVQKGFALDIDTVNLAFLAAGILLHRTPMAYARAVAGAARGAS